MKKILFLILLLPYLLKGQDLKISQLPVAGTLSGTEPVPIVQSGVTKQTTVSAIGALGGSVSGTGIAPSVAWWNGTGSISYDTAFTYMDNLQRMKVGFTGYGTYLDINKFQNYMTLGDENNHRGTNEWFKIQFYPPLYIFNNLNFKIGNPTYVFPSDTGSVGQVLTIKQVNKANRCDTLSWSSSSTITEPATQIVYGTGTGITSYPQFIYSQVNQNLRMTDGSGHTQASFWGIGVFPSDHYASDTLGDPQHSGRGTFFAVTDQNSTYTFNDSTFSIGGIVLNFPITQGATSSVLTNDGAGNLAWKAVSGGSGTVTNVATGYGLRGGDITTTGTLFADSTILIPWDDTLAGRSNRIVTNNYLNSKGFLSSPMAIANGGTGQTTANAAFNALAPSQTSQSGKFLTTNGTNTSWATVSGGSPSLTSTYIGYGDGSNLLTGDANWVRQEDGDTIFGIAIQDNSGNHNILIGAPTLFAGNGSLSGSENIAIGAGAYLANNSTSSIAIGAGAIVKGSSGGGQIAIGSGGAESESIEGIAIGTQSAAIGNESISIGANSNSDGSASIAMGEGAIANSTESIAIGYNATTHINHQFVLSNLIGNLIIHGDSMIWPNGNVTGVLTNDGSGNLSWSASGGGSGTVTSITAGQGLTGGTITTSGTIALPYTEYDAFISQSSTSAPTIDSVVYNSAGITVTPTRNSTGNYTLTISGGSLHSQYLYQLFITPYSTQSPNVAYASILYVNTTQLTLVTEDSFDLVNVEVGVADNCLTHSPIKILIY